MLCAPRGLHAAAGVVRTRCDALPPSAPCEPLLDRDRAVVTELPPNEGVSELRKLASKEDPYSVQASRPYRLLDLLELFSVAYKEVEAKELRFLVCLPGR